MDVTEKSCIYWWQKLWHSKKLWLARITFLCFTEYTLCAKYRYPARYRQFNNWSWFTTSKAHVSIDLDIIFPARSKMNTLLAGDRGAEDPILSNRWCTQVSSFKERLRWRASSDPPLLIRGLRYSTVRLFFFFCVTSEPHVYHDAIVIPNTCCQMYIS